jgi:hypothetical protein
MLKHIPKGDHVEPSDPKVRVLEWPVAEGISITGVSTPYAVGGWVTTSNDPSSFKACIEEYSRTAAYVQKMRWPTLNQFEPLHHLRRVLLSLCHRTTIAVPPTKIIVPVVVPPEI